MIPPIEHNQTGVDYRQPMSRPPVRGQVIDGHCHLLATRHCADWFAAADHFGIDQFITQSPLEEAGVLQRTWGHRLHFVAVPNWQQLAEKRGRLHDWLRRLDAFANLGAFMAKVHLAPGTLQRSGLSIDHDEITTVLHAIRDRGMVIMTHVGDPQLWYDGKYAADPTTFGSRELHYRQWEERLEEHRGWPWLGAHLGGWPEDLVRMSSIMDRFPDLWLDLSATRWMVREISSRRDDARAFILKYQDRILWGSDQVSFDGRDFDFFASRWWCHRKLFETAAELQTPILDPDLPRENQPMLRGLALPTAVIQKLYRDNSLKLISLGKTSQARRAA